MKFDKHIHDYYEELNLKKQVNMDLLLHNRQESLVDYIIEALRALERVPNIKIVGWELVEDEALIEPYLVNHQHSKTKIHYNKYLPMDENRFELLKVFFEIKTADETTVSETKLLLPRRYKKFYYLLGGNKFYPIYQMIDASTYNRKDSVVLKPLNLKRDKTVLYDVNGEPFNLVYYSLALFNKTVNPLLYYIAPLGYENMMRYMGVSDIIRVDKADDEVDNEKYYSFVSKHGMKLSVLKFFFNEDAFTQSMVYMVYKLIELGGVVELSELEDKDKWAIILGLNFTKNTNVETQLEKGKSVLVSFKSIATKIYKSNLKLDHVNKDSTYAIVRWIMRNFSELKIKDNLDLKNKRVRLNEYIADYFSRSVNAKLNRFLAINEKKVVKSDLEALVTYPVNEVIRKLQSSKSPLLRYDNSVNDLDFFTAFKYSIKGPSSLGVNSKSVPIHYRAIHWSQLGRIDINSSGSGDPGITGFFTPFVDMVDGKFFNSDTEPQNWTDNFERLREIYFEGKSCPFIPLEEYERVEKKTRKYLKSIQNVDKFVEDYAFEHDEGGAVKLVDVKSSKKGRVKVVKTEVVEEVARPVKRLFKNRPKVKKLFKNK